MNKPKVTIEVEVYDNGVGITIKKGKEVIKNKVFEGEFDECINRWKPWVNQVIEDEKAK